MDNMRWSRWRLSPDGDVLVGGAARGEVPLEDIRLWYLSGDVPLWLGPWVCQCVSVCVCACVCVCANETIGTGCGNWTRERPR